MKENEIQDIEGTEEITKSYQPNKQNQEQDADPEVPEAEDSDTDEDVPDTQDRSDLDTETDHSDSEDSSGSSPGSALSPDQEILQEVTTADDSADPSVNPIVNVDKLISSTSSSDTKVTASTSSNSTTFPKVNTTVEFKLVNNPELQRAVILSRQPKRRGRHGNWTNLRLQQAKKPISVNWDDVSY